MYFLGSCTDHIRQMLEKAGFIARIGTEHLFVSVHDAVIHAVETHSEVSACIYIFSKFLAQDNDFPAL